MYSVDYILNKDLTHEKLDEIVNVKTIAWPYPYNSQISWVRQHLSSLDIHVLLYKGSILVAYLNLIDTCIKINGESLKVYGVGNVCAIKRHEGYGKILIEKTNSFIKNRGRIGLLFCRQPLLKFYIQLGWKPNNRIYFSGFQVKEEVKALTFNMDNTDCTIEYSGQMF